MTEPVAKLERTTLRASAKDAPARLDAVDLAISRGIWAVLGPSGAGKTSLLNLLAGFEKPDQGGVKVPDVIGWAPADGALWPHLSAREHLEACGLDGDRGDSLLQAFALDDCAEQKPGKLSEGQRDRLAIARAIANTDGEDGSLLVLDEPLVHVEPARRREYWRQLKEFSSGSIIFSTHDPVDAIAEADHVICVDSGSIAFCGTVDELYNRPSDSRLADFLGPANWFADSLDLEEWSDGKIGDVREKGICLRPERLQIMKDDGGGFEVVDARFCGAYEEVDLSKAPTSGEAIHCRTFYHRPSAPLLKRGDRVALRMLSLILLSFITCLFSACDAGTELTVKHVESWNIPPEGPSLPSPRSLTCDSEGLVYVLDNAGRVLVMSPEGETLKKWPMPESSVGKPEGVLVLEDGRVVVCDTHYNRLVFFYPDGKVEKMIGSRGTEDGQFIFPVAIDQDDEGNLFVGEYGGNDRIQKFTKEGEFILSFGGFGIPDGDFQRPSGIACHGDRVFVSDAFNNRIQEFKTDGSFVGVVGGSEAPALDFPYDIVWSNEALMVIEYGAGRMTRISPDGKLLGRYGENGTALGQFFTPWGIAVDEEGRFRVADTGNRRVVAIELE